MKNRKKRRTRLYDYTKDEHAEYALNLAATNIALLVGYIRENVGKIDKK